MFPKQEVRQRMLKGFYTNALYRTAATGHIGQPLTDHGPDRSRLVFGNLLELLG